MDIHESQLETISNGMQRRRFIGLAGLAVPGGLLLAACGGKSAATTTNGASSSGAVAAPGAGPGRGFRFVYPQTGGTGQAFFAPIFNGAKQAGQDLGVTVDIKSTAKFDSIEQGRLVDAAAAGKPDGIVTGAWDADAMKGPITNAVKAGIPVVIINASPPGPVPFGALTYVGQDEKLAGQRAGEEMTRLGVKKVLIANHDPSQVNLVSRQAGFQAGFKGETKIIPVSISDPTASQSRIEAALQANSDFDGIFGLSAQLGGEPGLAAAKKLGKQSSIKVACFDQTPGVLTAIAAGELEFTVDQQQYLQGYYPIMLLALNKQYGFSAPGDFLTGPSLITKANATKIADLNKRGIR